jgi:signal transduction histidine kinase
MPVLAYVLLTVAAVALVGAGILIAAMIGQLRRQQNMLQQFRTNVRATGTLTMPRVTASSPAGPPPATGAPAAEASPVDANTVAQINEDLRRTKERLEKLDSVKTEFITVASHELRTPLTQIRGYIDILDSMNESGMLKRDQVSTMLGNLRRASDRMERLIGDMLDVSQLDTDAMDLRFAQGSVESMMKLAIEPFTEAINARRLAVTSRGLRNLPPIQADMQRIVQAFRNLIGNAIKYTPDGGQVLIKGATEIDPMTGMDFVKVTITDTGIGIDPKNHELIFEKFFRIGDPSLHSTGATKFMGAGPGLGLTISRGVILGHGGSITVESTGEDKVNFPGSTFTVRLPVRPPAGARRVEPFLPPKLPGANPDSRPLVSAAAPNSANG